MARKESIWIDPQKCKNGMPLKQADGTIITVRYYLRARLSDGRRISDGQGGYLTRSEAKAAITDFAIRIRNGEFEERDARTLREVFTKYLENKKSNNHAASTIAIVEYSTGKLMEFKPQDAKTKLGEKNIAEIIVDEIDEFKTFLKTEGHEPNGIHFILSKCNPVFTYARDRGLLKKRSAVLASLEGFETENNARFLTNAEVRSLTLACIPQNQPLRDYIKVALHTGMRPGEIRRMVAADIVAGHIQVISKPTKRTKTKRSRLVPLHENIAETVHRVIAAKWTKGRLNRTFGRAIKRAQKFKVDAIVGDVRPYDMRHTFASNYLQAGGTIADLMVIMGHRTLAALQVYAHFQRNYLAEKINRVTYEIPLTIEIPPTEPA